MNDSQLTADEKCFKFFYCRTDEVLRRRNETKGRCFNYKIKKYYIKKKYIDTH